MESKALKLTISTPFGEYFKGEVECINVQTSNFLLGILPGHAEMISDIVISDLVLTISGKRYHYAICGGLLRVNKDSEVLILTQAIERADEIDLDRANRALERANKRLEINEINSEAWLRAKAAIDRANNRIRIKSLLED